MRTIPATLIENLPKNGYLDFRRVQGLHLILNEKAGEGRSILDCWKNFNYTGEIIVALRKIVDGFTVDYEICGIQEDSGKDDNCDGGEVYEVIHFSSFNKDDLYDKVDSVNEDIGETYKNEKGSIEIMELYFNGSIHIFRKIGNNYNRTIVEFTDINISL